MASSSCMAPIAPAPPSLTHPVMKDGECIDWAELPSELTSSILGRLDTVDILENVQKVCTSWHRVCKDPVMWRKIDLGPKLGYLRFNLLEIMCRHAVDRSQGGLVEIDILHFGTDSLLNYIADSSSNLRSLRLAMCYLLTSEGLTEAVVKLPLLEELEVSHCTLSVESLRVVGQSLPNLKTLKLNRSEYRRLRRVSDDDALAIAETMPRLSHLQLFANGLTDAGLNAILDSCPNLAHLDLRHCPNINLFGDLKKRCSESIKVWRKPFDSTRDYPYDEAGIQTDPSEDSDYPSEDSDDPYPYDHGSDYSYDYDYYPSDNDDV